MTCDLKATGKNVMRSIWFNKWDDSGKGLIQRDDYCHEQWGYPSTSSVQSESSTLNATALEDGMSSMALDVTQKADMICKALWEPGKVTLDVGPNTLSAQPYQLAGCLGLND